MPRTTRLSLTNARVRDAKPHAPHRHDYADIACPSLTLRVFPSGEKSWIVTYYVKGEGGKAHQLSLGSADALALDDARKAAIETRQKARDHAHDAVQERRQEQQRERDAEPDTFGPTVDRFLPPRRAKSASVFASRSAPVRSWNILLKRVGKVWEHDDVADIKTQKVQKLLDKIAEDAPIESNRVRAALHDFFRWAQLRVPALSEKLSPVVATEAREGVRRHYLWIDEEAEADKRVALDAWARYLRIVIDGTPPNVTDISAHRAAAQA